MRERVFRALWPTQFASDLGGWMQTVGEVTMNLVRAVGPALGGLLLAAPLVTHALAAPGTPGPARPSVE